MPQIATVKPFINAIFAAENAQIMKFLFRKKPIIIFLIALIPTVIALLFTGCAIGGNKDDGLPKYTLIYSAGDGGSLTGEIEQTVKKGDDSTTVTAVPNDGYRFVEWSDGVTTATRLDEDITNDITVTAKFAKITYTVTYLTDGNGILRGEPTQTVEYGNTTFITAVPNEGYEFVQWSDGVVTAARTDKNVQTDVTVTAIFQKITYTVTYMTDGNGSVDGTSTQIIVYGENATAITAVPDEKHVFIKWSDGVTTAQRQDTEINADLTVTAYFGYKIVYTATEGGKIVGTAEYKLLPDDLVKETVTAVPDEGYVFCGWSDLSWQTSRFGDFVEKGYQVDAVWEYIAYFEPIEKTFNYDYGITTGTPLPTQITLNRNDIKSAEFTVPSCAGYTFCGWYADSDYRTRITTESGRYMYGYAAFSLETDTLYAKWQKDGDETNNHKILIIFVDEIQTDLYSSVKEQTISVHSKMTALDYGMGKWTVDTVYNLLNERFKGKTVFEVDAYYTTDVITDGFEDGISSGNISYTLYAPNIIEVAYLAHSYHNTITVFGLDDYEYNLRDSAGYANIKDCCVLREGAWITGLLNNHQLQNVLADCQSGKTVLEVTIIETCIHELAHTAELYYGYEVEALYGLHKCISYSFQQDRYADEMICYLDFLAGEFDMDGVICGIPAEYWNHEREISVIYHARFVDSKTAGKIKLLGKDDINSPIKTAISQRVLNGGEVTVEAVPLDGYRFVKWSDGITTAIRHDTNIIAYYYVWAIFEKT